jgi:hypothetical protein
VPCKVASLPSAPDDTALCNKSLHSNLQQHKGYVMPIPSNQITHVEIKVNAHSAAGGSTVKQFVNTFHFRRTGTVLAVPKGPIDTAFQAAIMVPVLAALNLRYVQTFNTVRYLNDALDPPNQFNHANVGGVAGDSMPLHNYVFTLFRTGLRGKSFRGGVRLGPIAESATTTGTDDILNAGAIALFAAVNAAILAGFTDATGNIWLPSLVSRKLSQLTKNPTNVQANDVSAVLTNKRIGKMKRREVASAY